MTGKMCSYRQQKLETVPPNFCQVALFILRELDQLRGWYPLEAKGESSVCIP